MKKLHGIVSAMVSTFDSNGRVDEGAMYALAQNLVERGVNGLYPCGTTGEMHSLKTEERKRLVRAVLRAGKDRVTVYAHCGAMFLEDSIELALDAWDAGADGVGFVTPCFAAMKDADVLNYYRQIFQALPKEIPVYLYSIPQLARNDISPEVLRQLASEYENLVGLKYSFADLYQTLAYTKAKPGISVLHGHDRFMSSFLMMGLDGCVSGISTVFPESYAKIYQAWQNRDIEAMQKYQSIAVSIAEVVEKHGGAAAFKSALKWRGFPGGPARMPIQSLTEDQEKEMFAKLDELKEKLEPGLLKSFEL